MMKAGTYFVGDLCYVMHDEWTEVCDLLFANRDDHGCNEGEFTLKDGRRFVCFNTAYGDGIYGSNNGTSHSVDSGSIGCIRIEDIRDPAANNAYMRGLGAIITFDTDFDVSTDGSTLTFGSMEVYTGDVEDEDEGIYLTSNFFGEEPEDGTDEDNV